MNRLWLKVVLVISLDGRITFANGGKAKIGGIGDRRVLEESLTWSDATLMGGETLRIYENTCLIKEEKFIQQRIARKMGKQPIALVASNKNNHSLDLPFFKQPINRWLVSSSISTDEFQHLDGYDHLILFKNNWSETLEKIANAGIYKIVILGGAKLISSLLIENQINELQLTFSPKILGGKYSWIPFDIDNIPNIFSNSDVWKLSETKQLENDEIMLRYIKSDINLSTIQI